VTGIQPEQPAAVNWQHARYDAQHCNGRIQPILGRLPHWGWCLLGTFVLAIGYVGLSIWLAVAPRAEGDAEDRNFGRPGRDKTHAARFGCNKLWPTTE